MCFLTYAITGTVISSLCPARREQSRVWERHQAAFFAHSLTLSLFLPTRVQCLQRAQLPGRRSAAELSERLRLYEASLEERSPGVILGPCFLSDGHLLCTVRDAVLTKGWCRSSSGENVSVDIILLLEMGAVSISPDPRTALSQARELTAFMAGGWVL